MGATFGLLGSIGLVLGVAELLQRGRLRLKSDGFL
jgi:hypothetical protein